MAQRIAFNTMIRELIERSERGESALIAFYKVDGSFTTKRVFYGAPRTNERKNHRSTMTKKGERKKEFRQGKLVLTDADKKTLLTPYSRLIVGHENKQVWH